MTSAQKKAKLAKEKKAKELSIEAPNAGIVLDSADDNGADLTPVAGHTSQLDSETVVSETVVSPVVERKSIVTYTGKAWKRLVSFLADMKFAYVSNVQADEETESVTFDIPFLAGCVTQGVSVKYDERQAMLIGTMFAYLSGLWERGEGGLDKFERATTDSKILNKQWFVIREITKPINDVLLSRGAKVEKKSLDCRYILGKVIRQGLSSETNNVSMSAVELDSADF